MVTSELIYNILNDLALDRKLTNKEDIESGNKTVSVMEESMGSVYIIFDDGTYCVLFANSNNCIELSNTTNM